MKNLDEMTDEELAVQYVGGNTAAFDKLLQRTKDGLFSYILYVVHDEDLANDVFQETFIKAILCLKKGKYSPSGKFAAWLVRIAHNIIMDTYRHDKQNLVVDADSNNNIANVYSDELLGASQESVMASNQVLDDVKEVMNLLPAKQREVVYMRYFQNLSFKEIAEATGVSINTSLGRMRYAIMNMRKIAKENNIRLYVD